MKKNFEEILSENLSLSAEDRAQIVEAWETRIADEREEITAELRQEFADKFEHDKHLMAESVEKFLNDRLEVEMQELAEDKQKLSDERVAYKAKVKEHAALLNTFITQQLADEVKELHSERAKIKENVGKLEEFVLKQLSEEIKEFHADKKALAEQRVKMVSEGKKVLSDTKAQFITRAAKVIEENINNVLRQEIAQYRDDIKAARENDFGRRIFESFVGEYMTSYLNEGTEVAKLKSVMSDKEQAFAALEDALAEQKAVTEGVNRKLKATQDRLNRDKKLTQLLAPLSSDKKEIMGELLESVKTENLENAYNKYLGAVLSEGTKVKTKQRTLKEGTEQKPSKVEKTGDRARTALNESEDQELALELQNIIKLAGIKK